MLLENLTQLKLILFDDGQTKSRQNHQNLIFSKRKR